MIQNGLNTESLEPRYNTDSFSMNQYYFRYPTQGDELSSHYRYRILPVYSLLTEIILFSIGALQRECDPVMMQFRMTGINTANMRQNHLN